MVSFDNFQVFAAVGAQVQEDGAFKFFEQVVRQIQAGQFSFHQAEFGRVVKIFSLDFWSDSVENFSRDCQKLELAQN